MSLKGIIPDSTGKSGKGKKKTPPSTYIRIYHNKEHSTFPDLLSGRDTEQGVFTRFFGSSSPTEMKRSLLVLHNMMRDGLVKIVPIEVEGEGDEPTEEEPKVEG